MKRFGKALNSAVCASALMLASCGGDGGSTTTANPSPTPSPSPSPSPSPTPTPTPTPTYQTLADLVGDQTFQTGGVTYEIVASNPIANPSAQAFGSGTVIEFIDASGIIRFTAPGGMPIAEVLEADGVELSPGVTQWRLPVGSPSPEDVITLFQEQSIYSFLGIWSHADGGTTTFRLGTGGVPTQDNDYPATATSYDMAVGGSVNDGTGAKLVDASRSSGTFTMDFSAGTGNFSVELFDDMGASLGTLTANVTFTSGQNGFSGTVSLGGNSGEISGAFFGPNAQEIGFGMALANGTNTYAGLGGGSQP